ncbi:glycosyltransferase family 39 protein [Roseiconus lacunae]|uniref:glycosyltransferase family 39 protein n=1 Tax=Roseiconus lacunae TaxID=2605694 RepID=UPI003086226C|nr:glycosyltransferase family 39 protein [Stieleria sp. HD01]
MSGEHKYVLMGWRLKPKLALAILFILLLTKVVAFVLRGPSPLIWDANYYWILGESVAQGDWLLTGHEVAFRTPGYPWLVGSLQRLTSSPLWSLVCVQAGLWLATVMLAASLARQFVDDMRAAAVVLAIAAVMVSSLTYVNAVLTETLFTFAVLVHLWFVARFVRQPNVMLGAFVGATLAAAMLIRPVAMLLWVADVGFLLVSRWAPLAPEKHQHCWRRTLISVAVAGVVTLGCVTPWLARNHAMFGKWMMTEFVGRNIWIVTFQDGSGAGLPMPTSDSAARLKSVIGQAGWEKLRQEDRWRETWTVSKTLTRSGLDDAQTDQLMKAVAFDAIAQDPTSYAKKTIRRWLNFWRTRATELPESLSVLEHSGGGFDGQTNRQEIVKQYFAGERIWGRQVAIIDTALRHRASNSLMATTLVMVLSGLATMLVVLHQPTRAAGVWFALILAYFSAVTAVLEIPGYRYRMIVEPMMLIVIAMAVVLLIRKWDSRRLAR